jgi:small conductance mechanosensitive channel
MSYLSSIVFALVILIFGFQIVKIIVKLIKKTMEKAKNDIDPSVSTFVLSLVNIGLKILVIVAVVGVLGVPTTSFAAVIGAAGLALGLALQGSLSNFAGGILILLLKPFTIGDFIEGSGHSGVVKSITIFYTYMDTVDNKVIMIPNGQLSNNSITNYSRNSTRRVDFVFGVGYDSSIDQVKDVINKIIEQHDKILKDPEPFVRLSQHNDSSLDFTVRVWVNAADYWTVYFDLTEEVKIAFDDADIDIPYPHMVNIVKNS